MGSVLKRRQVSLHLVVKRRREQRGVLRNLKDSEIARRVKISREDDRFVIRLSLPQKLKQRFGVRSLSSNELLLKRDAPRQTSRTLARTFFEFQVTTEIVAELFKQLAPMRNAPNRYCKAADRNAFPCFYSLGQRIGPITNVDCGSRKNVDLIIVLQQHRIVPRERLRSAHDCFVATLNDDCDPVHISPPCRKAPIKVSAIRSLLKHSWYLLRP